MEILVDSCILLDILTEDPTWYPWSAQTIQYYADNHVLMINPIIYYEIFFAFDSIQALEAAVPESYFRRVQIPWNAALLASKRFSEYRKAGGKKHAPLPDFLIGAHAVVQQLPLITRMLARYQEFFPEVQLISP